MLPCGAGARQPRILASSTHRMGHLVPDPADPMHTAGQPALRQSGPAASPQPPRCSPRWAFPACSWQLPASLEQGWSSFAPGSLCSWGQGGDTENNMPLLCFFPLLKEINENPIRQATRCCHPLLPASHPHPHAPAQDTDRASIPYLPPCSQDWSPRAGPGTWRGHGTVAPSTARGKACADGGSLRQTPLLTAGQRKDAFHVRASSYPETFRCLGHLAETEPSWQQGQQPQHRVTTSSSTTALGTARGHGVVGTRRR